MTVAGFSTHKPEGLREGEGAESQKHERVITLSQRMYLALLYSE